MLRAARNCSRWKTTTKTRFLASTSAPRPTIRRASLDAPLGYKGVVFNEMKGNYSSPDSLVETYTRQSLFPNSIYGVDSGGDPRAIPDLTYEQFKAFHETYYHPSNALIFFYGDDN